MVDFMVNVINTIHGSYRLGKAHLHSWLMGAFPSDETSSPRCTVNDKEVDGFHVKSP